MRRSRSGHSVRVLAAAAGEDYPHGESVHSSVSVRRIHNGYVRQESRSENGEHSSRETYHRKHPGVRAKGAPHCEAEDVTDSCGLRGAMGALK